ATTTSCRRSTSTACPRRPCNGWPTAATNSLDLSSTPRSNDESTGDESLGSGVPGSRRLYGGGAGDRQRRQEIADDQLDRDRLPGNAAADVLPRRREEAHRLRHRDVHAHPGRSEGRAEGARDQ